MWFFEAAQVGSLDSFKLHAGTPRFSWGVRSAEEFENPQKSSDTSSLSRRKQGFDSPRGRQFSAATAGNSLFGFQLAEWFAAGLASLSA